ncbi:hypothetical protein [Microbulbifer epialgicus]|uniref:Uncharacterized protein n=1 Tax=Microbulbifer epialgicus TaxID=393907 RepID=A0ABV4P2G7_9GAMM
MTKLDAVNYMLVGIGEAPVNQLGEAFADARIAETILSQTNTTVQAKGWYFNTENHFKLSRSFYSELKLPKGTLSVDTGSTDVVQRGLYLYDNVNKTKKFQSDMVVHLVLEIAFEELPHEAMMAVLTTATRRFQQTTVGSVTLDKFLEENERKAHISLLQSESENAHHNLKENPEFRLSLRRDGGVSFSGADGYLASLYTSGGS